MLSFYGNEHFCPLSLLRVLGASMMDVYEESQLKAQQGASGGNGHTPVTLPPSEGFGEGQGLVCVGEVKICELYD